MEEVKKDMESGWSGDRKYFGHCHAFMHLWWIKALVALVVLVLVFCAGVQFGEHHSWYGHRDFGGRFGGFVPMMYQQGNYAQPQNGGGYYPGGMMRGYYQQEQNPGATTTPQTAPTQP